MRAPIELTDNARPAVHEVDAIDEHGAVVPIAIAAGHPLALRLDRRELAVLTTLGTAPEHLAIGHLRNRRILASIDEIAAVQVDWQAAAVTVTSRRLRETGATIWEHSGGGEGPHPHAGRSTASAGRGQGGTYGAPAQEIEEAVHLPAHARLSEEVLHAVIERVSRHESARRLAGTVEDCALCSNAGESRGEILCFVEDLRQHDAADAIAGRMWLEGRTGGDEILFTSGRLTPGIVARCARMGIPFLLSPSMPTQAGFDAAQRAGLTMIGRCRGRHYLVFTGAQRLLHTPATGFA